MAVAEMRRAYGAAAIFSLRPLVSARWQGACANGSCSCRFPPNFEHSPDRHECAGLAAAPVAECRHAGNRTGQWGAGQDSGSSAVPPLFEDRALQSVLFA